MEVLYNNKDYKILKNSFVPGVMSSLTLEELDGITTADGTKLSVTKSIFYTTERIIEDLRAKESELLKFEKPLLGVIVKIPIASLISACNPNFSKMTSSGLAIRCAKVTCFPGTYSCIILCFSSNLVNLLHDFKRSEVYCMLLIIIQ